MARRYHQSKKDRRDEHAAMERFERGPLKHHAMKRRYLEHDTNKIGSHRGYRDEYFMITEDWSAPALLPRQVIDKYFPRGAAYELGTADDLFTGANKCIREDSDDLRRIAKPSKY